MDGVTTDHWWGAAAAIGCGLGIRYFPAVVGVGGVGGVSAVVAACLLMLLDAADALT